MTVKNFWTLELRALCNFDLCLNGRLLYSEAVFFLFFIFSVTDSSIVYIAALSRQFFSTLLPMYLTTRTDLNCEILLFLDE